MKPSKLSNEEKTEELKMYRDLVVATLNYWLINKDMHLVTPEFNAVEYFEQLKIQTEEYFLKGRLTMLKQWFRNLIEMHVEGVDLKFNQYLRDSTGHNIDIFKSYFDRIEKIVMCGKITSDNQFYDVKMAVDQLCQNEPLASEKISVLNDLISDYEHRKSRKIKS